MKTEQKHNRQVSKEVICSPGGKVGRILWNTFKPASLLIISKGSILLLSDYSQNLRRGEGVGGNYYMVSSFSSARPCMNHHHLGSCLLSEAFLKKQNTASWPGTLKTLRDMIPSSTLPPGFLLSFSSYFFVFEAQEISAIPLLFITSNTHFGHYGFCPLDITHPSLFSRENPQPESVKAWDLSS